MTGGRQVEGRQEGSPDPSSELALTVYRPVPAWLAPCWAPPAPMLLPETSDLVFQYCDAAALCAAAPVCRDWKRRTERDELWERLVLKHWGLKVDTLQRKPRPVKQFFRFQKDNFCRLMRRYRYGTPQGELNFLESVSRIG